MEVQTLVVVAFVVGILLISVLTFIWRTRRTFPGFGYWTLQYFALLAGLVALCLRNLAPDLVPVLFGNGLLFVGSLLALQGVRSFFGRDPLLLPSLFALALFELGLAFFLYAMPDVRARILLFSVFGGAAFLAVARELLFRAPKRLLVPSRFTGVVMAGYAIFLLLRGPMRVIWLPTAAFFALNGLDAAAFLAFIGVAILGTYGFVLMDGQRLENEIKATRDRLEEKEGYLKTIIDSVQTGVIIVDAGTRMILDANAIACALINEPKEAIVGAVCHRYLCPREHGECPVTDSGRTINGSEGEVVDRDGTPIPVIRSVVNVTISGRPCFLESFIDITRRQRAEEAVRESERLLRTVFDSSADVMVLKDRDLRYRAANPVLCSILGKTEKEIVGKTVDELFPEDLAHLYQEGDRIVIETRQPLMRDERARGPLGDCFVSTIKTPVIDEKGECVGIVGVVRDITDRKLMEEAVRLSERKFSLAFHQSPAVMAIVLARNRQIMEVNRAFEEHTGYSRDEVIGRTAAELGLWVDPEVSALFNRTIDVEGRSHGQEAVFRTKSGEERIGLTSAEAIEYAGEICILAVAEDVTERKRAEEARFVRRKLESIGILAGGMAHDFSNLLTIMSLNIELAATEAKDRKEMGIYLEEARRAAITASGLTHQLTTFADGALPLRTAVSMHGLLKESVAFALEGSQLACDFSLPADLWDIWADARQIGEVIQAIALNAREATTGVGRVTVAAENVIVKGALGVPAAEGDYVKLSIADGGCGISDEILPKIFDPYFSTKERGGQRGMGLGLTVAHVIMQRHGGAITVESAKGIGTTLHLYFPASRSAKGDRA